MIYNDLPLPAPKSIRLLTILPGETEDIIKCELSVADLEENPRYDALSYVWGPVTPQVNINCNGQIVGVTSNLAGALRCLRSRAANSSSKSGMDNKIFTLSSKIWIDALCINQEDLDERSNQVTFMKDIYDSAEVVTVWLGEDQGFTSQAMELVSKIASIGQQEPDYNPENFPFRFSPAEELEVTNHPRENLPSREDESWNSLFMFYENAWFRRIWVIQEVAREDALVMVGEQEIQLFSICLCAEWMRARRYLTTMRTRLALDPALHLSSMRRGAPLFRLLNFTSQREATDPRDRIYALLGLYSKWLNDNEKGKLLFKPDYRKTVPQVYSDLVRYFIALPKDVKSQEGSLSIMLRNDSFVRQGDFLAEPEDTGDDEQFPSWVPRWDQSRLAFISFEASFQGQDWSPGGSYPILVGDNPDPTILSLRGFEVSEITFLEREFEVPNPPFESEAGNQAIQHILAGPIMRAWRYFPGRDNAIKDALAQTLTASNAKDLGWGETLDRRDLEAYLSDGSKSWLGRRFAMNILGWRTFFITSDGYMGMGSRKMQLGDKICVLFGGQVLFILRPQGTMYRLVGDCYVHGLMYGEAMERLRASQLVEKWLELC